MEGYKGFGPDMTCRSMKYEVGRTYVHEGPVKKCKSGFHLCRRAIDVLGYYPPFMFRTDRDDIPDDGFARYGYVKGEGRSDGDGEKIAFEKLTVVKEIPLSDYVEDCVGPAPFDRPAIMDGKRSGARSESPRGLSACTGQECVAVSHGYKSGAVVAGGSSIAYTDGSFSVSACTDQWSVATAEGNYSIAAAPTHQSGAGTSGRCSLAATTGWHSRAQAAGDCSAACVIGKGGTAEITGRGCVALLLGNDNAGSSCGSGMVVCAGSYNRARGKLGDFLVFADKDGEGKVTGIRVCRIDGVRYKPDTWYGQDEVPLIGTS